MLLELGAMIQYSRGLETQMKLHTSEGPFGTVSIERS